MTSLQRGIGVALIGLALTGGTVSHAAQTHPCDQAARTSQTIGSAAVSSVQFCANPSEGPEAFTIYTNGIASDLRPLTMTVAPNALGKALYEGPRELHFAKGSYVIQVTLWNTPFDGGASQESAKSDPLSLSAVDERPPAEAPKIVGLIR